MSKKSKSQEFHFTLGFLFRLIIFTLIIYFSINYLSNNSLTAKNSTNTNILGVNSEPVIIKATEIFNNYQKQALDFVNLQIIDIKKQVVTEIYQNILKSIDNSQK